MKTTLNHDVLAALAPLFELPERLTALDLRLRVDEVPTLTCTFFGTIELDVTKLDSRAREFVLDPAPVTKRYRLEEITD